MQKSPPPHSQPSRTLSFIHSGFYHLNITNSVTNSMSRTPDYGTQTDANDAKEPHRRQRPHRWPARETRRQNGQQGRTHCNTLQHTATHCNTLQHTATHCNTLQHTATHCNTLQHTATHCNTLQVKLGGKMGNKVQTHCNTLQHAATCCILHHTTAKIGD